MIVIGYQGIGKSTLAKKKSGYIDLESGCFWHDGDRIDDWYIYYCQIAEHLSSQGNVVFVSSHKPVREYLKSSNERAICVYPSILLSEKWKIKLLHRYNETGLEKDHKAWLNAEEMYHDNISDLMMCGIPHAEIDHMNYDLHEIILGVIKRNPEIDFHVWKLFKADDSKNKAQLATENYNIGYVEGYEQGKECGYDKGYNAGYNEGLNEGYEIAKRIEGTEGNG